MSVLQPINQNKKNNTLPFGTSQLIGNDENSKSMLKYNSRNKVKVPFGNSSFNNKNIIFDESVSSNKLSKSNATSKKKRIVLGDISNSKNQENTKKSQNGVNIKKPLKSTSSSILTEKKVKVASKQQRSTKVTSGSKKKSTDKKKNSINSNNESFHNPIIFKETRQESKSRHSSKLDKKYENSFYDDYEYPAGKMWHEQSDDEISDLSFMKEVKKDIREAIELEDFRRFKRPEVQSDDDFEDLETRFKDVILALNSFPTEQIKDPDIFEDFQDFLEMPAPRSSWRKAEFHLSDIDSDFDY